MTGILPSGKLSNMMPHALPAVLLAAFCGVPALLYAETAPSPVRQTSATVVIHEGVREVKPGEVPLDPKACNMNTIGELHVVNGRYYACRLGG